jgi:hypothetical protein
LCVISIPKNVIGLAVMDLNRRAAEGIAKAGIMEDALPPLDTPREAKKIVRDHGLS